MESIEPPNNLSGRPNLLTPSRCSSDAQQQILARLEVKAAEKARMMAIAHRSLRVAGMTAAGIGVAVALLVAVKQHNAPQKPVVAMVAAPSQPLPGGGTDDGPHALAPMPTLKVDPPRDKLGSGALAALLLDGSEQPAAGPRAQAPATRALRAAASAAQKPARARLLAAARGAKPKLRQLGLLTPPASRPQKAAMGLAAAVAAKAPIDTDVSLLSAILLHASRPAVVPPIPQRPACPARPAHPACGDFPPDP